MDTRKQNSNFLEEPIRLTQTVKKGGCAAKLPAGTLRKILSRIPQRNIPELYVGFESLDDAALWELDDSHFLIQTVDFFTPILDDPYDFGAVAAANALSDVYAMGGQPKIALTILAFPTADLPESVLSELMQGAADKIHEAGAVIAGGHSIDDETLKLGFSVSGFVKKNKAWTNSHSKPGDVLFLTKELGTGTLCARLKFDKLSSEVYKDLKKSMTLLNNVPHLFEQDSIPVHAATDITGFGFLGHALQMAKASHVCFEVEYSKLPKLPGAIESLQAEFLTKAHKTNWDYAKEEIEFHSTFFDFDRLLLCDPQTSGGLLLSIPAEYAEKAYFILKERFPHTQQVGRVLKKEKANQPHVQVIP